MGSPGSVSRGNGDRLDAVSTPETTAYDHVRFAPAAGHLSKVATVLGELSERIEAGAPVASAPSYQVPKVQRLGYLLALLGEHDLAAHLAAWLKTRRFRGFGWRGGAGRRGAPGSAVAGGSQRARGGRGLIPRAHVTAWRADHERPKG